jgi:hypothetical protein
MSCSKLIENNSRNVEFNLNIGVKPIEPEGKGNRVSRKGRSSGRQKEKQCFIYGESALPKLLNLKGELGIQGVKEFVKKNYQVRYPRIYTELILMLDLIDVSDDSLKQFEKMVFILYEIDRKWGAGVRNVFVEHYKEKPEIYDSMSQFCMSSMIAFSDGLTSLI